MRWPAPMPLNRSPATAAALCGGPRRHSTPTRSATITVGANAAEPAVDLLAPTEGQDVVIDCAHTGRTLRRHVLAPTNGGE
jgi:hypothetical protein